MIPRVITARWLRSKGACIEQRNLFRATFGERAEVTLRNLRRADRHGIDPVWLSGRMGDAGFYRFQELRSEVSAGLTSEQYDAACIYALWCAIKADWKEGGR